MSLSALAPGWTSIVATLTENVKAIPRISSNHLKKRKNETVKRKNETMKRKNESLKRDGNVSSKERIVSRLLLHAPIKSLGVIDVSELIRRLSEHPDLLKIYIKMIRNREICDLYTGQCIFLDPVCSFPRNTPNLLPLSPSSSLTPGTPPQPSPTIHSAVMRPRPLPASPATSRLLPPPVHSSTTTNFIQKRYLLSGRNRFLTDDVVGRLQRQADSSPMDAKKQLEYLRSIASRNPHEVKTRVESGLYAVNEPIIRLYSETVTGGFNTSQSKNSESYKTRIATGVIALGIFLYLYGTVNVSFGGGLDSLGINSMNFESTLPRVTFEDVAGNEAAMSEIRELVTFLTEPETYTRMGCKIPKGYLLSGPPGVGKTLLARALAGEAGVPFFQASGSQFEEMFVGLGAKRIRKLFADARKKSPSIIFIDEIDSVANKRETSLSYSNRPLVNQILSEMDGFEDNSGVIVIAATNDPQSLDEAIIREGRFDTKITFKLPNTKDREEILKVHTRDKVLDGDVDLRAVATACVGMTGAQLATLANFAALSAVDNDHNSVTAEDFEHARAKLYVGPVNVDMTFTPEDLTNTAAHEAGHAILSMLREEISDQMVYIATIEPRGNSLGHVQPVHKTDQYKLSNEQMIAAIDVAFGGRVGEELFHNFEKDRVTTGCSSDMKRATELAEMLIRNNGYSPNIGYSQYGASDSKNNRTDQKIFEEVKRLLDERYEVVRQDLKKHEKEWRMLTKHLITYRTLTGEEVRTVFNGGIIMRDTT